MVCRFEFERAHSGCSMQEWAEPRGEEARDVAAAVGQAGTGAGEDFGQDQRNGFKAQNKSFNSLNKSSEEFREKGKLPGP